MKHALPLAAAALLGSVLLGAAVAAGAHSPGPGDAIAEIRGGEAHEPVGLRAVARSPELPRMLVVRVGPGWESASAARRREVATRWRATWRRVEPNGIVAVVDDESLESRVSYDRQGRAHLKDPPRVAGSVRE